MAEHLHATSNLILYRTEDGQTRIEVRPADGTVWMTQASMAELYQGTKQNVIRILSTVSISTSNGIAGKTGSGN